MKQETKQQLLNCYNQDKITLFELTFNTNYLFYEKILENFLKKIIK